MDTGQIRSALAVTHGDEVFSKRLHTLLIQLSLRATQREDADPEVKATCGLFASQILGFVESYVHFALDVLDASQATPWVHQFLEDSVGNWRSSTLALEEFGALALADQAFYTLTLLERLNARLQAAGQVSLIENLGALNNSMRWLLGDERAGRIDELVKIDLADAPEPTSEQPVAPLALENPPPTLSYPVPAILKALATQEVQRLLLANTPETSVHVDRSDLFPTWSTEAHVYPVWFATNRQPLDPLDLKRGFANQRNPAGHVYYGCCDVSVPKTHKFGEVGTPWWKRWWKLEFADDHLRLTHCKVFAGVETFHALLQNSLSKLGAQERQVLVFIHGYRTSFEQAAIQAAQLGFDLKIPGATAFFSWPSQARPEGYSADVESIGASETQIMEFLTLLVQQTGATTVHILAHSMGNRGLIRVIQRLTEQATASTGVKFGQVILAAADVEVSLFRSLAARYKQVAHRTTLYASRKDLALVASSWLQSADRVGYIPPVTVVPEIDTIEVTDIDLTTLGHGYFADAEPVLYDMYDLLRNDAHPDDRLRLQKIQAAESLYWRISK